MRHFLVAALNALIIVASLKFSFQAFSPFALVPIILCSYKYLITPQEIDVHTDMERNIAPSNDLGMYHVLMVVLPAVTKRVSWN